MLKTFKADIEDNGKRFDNYLIKILKNVPKSLIYRMIRKGVIRINGKKAKALDRVWENDTVKVPTKLLKNKSEGVAPNWLKNLLKNSIIHEDNHVIVVDKPFGIPSHGGSKLKFGVIETIRQIKQDEKRIDLVHRLDRATSGCLLLAKNHLILKDMHKISSNVNKYMNPLDSLLTVLPTTTSNYNSNMNVSKHKLNVTSNLSSQKTGLSLVAEANAKASKMVQPVVTPIKSIEDTHTGYQLCKFVYSKSPNMTLVVPIGCALVAETDIRYLDLNKEVPAVYMCATRE